MISSWYVTFSALQVLNMCVYDNHLINSVYSPFRNTISKNIWDFSLMLRLFAFYQLHDTTRKFYKSRMHINFTFLCLFYVCWQLPCSFIIGLFQTDSADQNGARPATEAASKKHLQHHSQSSLLTGFRTEMKLCMRISRTENKRSSSIADVM